ncbi:hypothetical protein P175DRAFT_0527490 [Aspergillus ochraceoroseus IBT 24754]|uniref:Uncharacterized protein n=1 Tax=Aspergillus ochraceoroseus IBT 24754 TaxID=1392256 RepID=A0A2T5M681_9EURO|nr:uncharacterized protein P175DRAFT_0527490 [Aspergillus ochraceoroseus IBT 24754]PTU24034.1 hypothetical protein P175DRAFT_0527490 [Aspergillus ochraceoroseus IBT 24754]
MAVSRPPHGPVWTSLPKYVYLSWQRRVTRNRRLVSVASLLSLSGTHHSSNWYDELSISLTDEPIQLISYICRQEIPHSSSLRCRRPLCPDSKLGDEEGTLRANCMPILELIHTGFATPPSDSRVVLHRAATPELSNTAFDDVEFGFCDPHIHSTTPGCFNPVIFKQVRVPLMQFVSNSVLDTASRYMHLTKNPVNQEILGADPCICKLTAAGVLLWAVMQLILDPL